jgi:hypothetical protein
MVHEALGEFWAIRLICSTGGSHAVLSATVARVSRSLAKVLPWSSTA